MSRRGKVYLAIILVGAVVLGVAIYRSLQPVGTTVVEREIPTAPAATPAIGMYVQSEVESDGRVRVAQWIRTEEPLTELTLQLPDPDNLPGTLEARKVVVTGNGTVLGRRATVGTARQTLALDDPGTELYVTYVIYGGVVTSDSVAGRALARVTSLDVDYTPADGPVVRSVASTGPVLTLGCVDRDDPTSPRPCGTSGADGSWQVDLEGARRADRVSASVEFG